jgi:hypothetical protein
VRKTLLALALLTVPLGLIVHLFAELAEFGAADAGLIVSPRHDYLWASLAGLLIAGIVAIRRLGAREALANVRRLGRALPFAGKGVGFFLVAASAQFGVFAATQVAEGDPMLGGSLAVGIAAAVAGAVISTLIVALLGRTIVRAAGELVWYVTRTAAQHASSAAYAYRRAVRLRVRSTAQYRLRAPNRAPPSFILATA